MSSLEQGVGGSLQPVPSLKLAFSPLNNWWLVQTMLSFWRCQFFQVNFAVSFQGGFHRVLAFFSERLTGWPVDPVNLPHWPQRKKSPETLQVWPDGFGEDLHHARLRKFRHTRPVGRPKVQDGPPGKIPGLHKWGEIYPHPRKTNGWIPKMMGLGNGDSGFKYDHFLASRS